MEKTVVHTINTLGELLTFTMRERRVSLRTVAPVIGCSISTISRITQGKGFDAKWIIPIAEWCDLNKLDDAEELWDLL